MRILSNYICFGVCFGLGFAFLCCQKSVNTTDVIHIHASRTTALADGSSVDTIYADLPIETLASNRGVTFFSASGLFANGFDTMSTFATHANISPDKITAIVYWRASLRSGPDTLSASNTTTPQYTDYLILTLTSSNVDSIQLLPSSPTVKDTFGMEVTITGLLTNSQGGPVSQGGTVKFTDLNTTGGPAGGNFSPPVVNIDSSKVSTIYFPLALAAGAITGNTITIRAVAMDAGGNPIGRPGVTKILISP